MPVRSAENQKKKNKKGDTWSFQKHLLQFKNTRECRESLWDLPLYTTSEATFTLVSGQQQLQNNI